MINFYDSSREGEQPKYYLINKQIAKQNHLFSHKEDRDEWGGINEKAQGLKCNEIGEIEDLPEYQIVSEFDICQGDVQCDNTDKILRWPTRKNKAL